jgi:hypothetical protein
MRSLAMFLCLLLAAPAVAADAASTRDSGDAAHLFGYRAHPGARERFDAGYRQHLQWHRAHRDPLVWYGWYVADGPRAGMFVDGTFGAPFAAFDQRVDPKGDAADAAANVNAHAEAVLRASYRVRREFSTGLPLEQWRPSPTVQVLHYRLRPGMQLRFERALAVARERLRGVPDAQAHTWYEKLTGGPLPEFMLLVARDGWADYDAELATGLETLLHGSPALDDLAASVEIIEAETWTYRADLSLIPGQ